MRNAGSLRTPSLAQPLKVNLRPEVAMRNVTFLALLVIILASPAAAQFVAPGGAIPAVANIPGENNTFWRSDVSILNVSSAATSVQLFLFP